MEEYVNFDRHTDAQASLAEFLSCIDLVLQNSRMWKYAIISIHNALQGYLCLSLAGGNSFQTWNEAHLKKWLEGYRNNKQLPDTKIDYFMELYDKAFSDDDDIDRKNIAWLNDTRNNLIHFNSDSFSVHIESAFRCCKDALRAISATPNKAVGIFYYEEEQKDRLETLLMKAGEFLNEVENQLNKRKYGARKR